MLQIWTNDTDYVIAETEQDALQLACEQHGENVDDYTADEWRALTDDETFSFWPDWEDKWNNPAAKEVEPVSWFIAKYGRGYLACTEY